MSLTKEEILKVSKLANLNLTDNEVDKFSQEITSIIDFNITSLSEVDTDGVEPTAHVTGEISKLRADETLPSLLQEKVLQNAKETKDGYFKVPQILGD